MTQSTNLDIRKVTLIGAGVIGASWATLMLARGLEVCVNDPRPDVETMVRDYISRAAGAMAALGHEVDSQTVKLTFEADVARAVAGADAVQENGPERIAFKRELWAKVSAAAPAHALFLSSSSGLPATEQAAEMSAPERMVIGHPFNPPHVIPLVEVVPGEKTSDETVKRAVAFYESLGKVPRVVHKEIPGFVANRLQAAIFRECVSLVSKGVVTVDELDDIVTHSVGLRWAVGGPFASFYLGGGEHGMRGFIEHFAPGMASRWESMKAPVAFDAETNAVLIEQTDKAFGHLDHSQMESTRDEQQIAILKVLAGC